MNYQFRKKPVVIEAFQMTEARRADNSEWPTWLHKAWNIPAYETGSLFPMHYPLSDGTEPLVIATLEGLMQVDWNDYIIQGVKGEIYACKPDIFEMTYEEVE